MRRYRLRLMKRLTNAINALPSAVVLIAAAALVVGVGRLDRATGLYLSFALFYLAPIGLAAWFCGRAAGLTIALLGSIVGLIGDVSIRGNNESSSPTGTRECASASSS